MSKDKETEREERTIFIVLAIILLIAIGIIVTWYFTRNKEDKKLKDKKKPETKEVVKKEDDTTEEIAYVEPEVVQTVATTEETKVEIPAPVITYGSEINSLLKQYQNGIDLSTTNVNLDDFKNDVTAEDYQGNNVTVETLIVAYMIDGSQWNITNEPNIQITASIDKIVISYKATDNDGRVTTKTIVLDVNNNIANLQITNENKQLKQEKGQYSLIIDQNEKLELSFYSNNIKETSIDNKNINQSDQETSYIEDVIVKVDENDSNAGTVTYSKSVKDLDETLTINVNNQILTINITKVGINELKIDSKPVTIKEDGTIEEITAEGTTIGIELTLTDETSNMKLIKDNEEIAAEKEQNKYKISDIQLNEGQNKFEIVVENQGIKKEYTFIVTYNNPSPSSMSAINLETNFGNEIISLKSNKDMEEPKEEIKEEIDECETNTEEEKVEETELDQNTELEDTINSLENE